MIMAAQTCRSIRDSLLAFVHEELEVSVFENKCIVTLPLKSLDDRFLDVYIEKKIGDYCLVHDGGRAASELYAQGIHLTDSRRALLKSLAQRYGATFDVNDDTFKIGISGGPVQPAILAIAQCASLAMHDVLTHTATVEGEPIRARVRRSLDGWHTRSFEIRHHVPIDTATASGTRHAFDSVAFPTISGLRTVAVTVLTPGYGPPVQAARYGFLALDIKGTSYDEWPRLAVVSKADQWGGTALKIVRSFSSRTLEVPTGEDGLVEEALPKRIEELSVAA